MPARPAVTCVSAPNPLPSPKTTNKVSAASPRLRRLAPDLLSAYETSKLPNSFRRRKSLQTKAQADPEAAKRPLASSLSIWPRTNKGPPLSFSKQDPSAQWPSRAITLRTAQERVLGLSQVLPPLARVVQKHTGVHRSRMRQRHSSDAAAALSLPVRVHSLSPGHAPG
jgi:hypothetical protein